MAVPFWISRYSASFFKCRSLNGIVAFCGDLSSAGNLLTSEHQRLTCTFRSFYLLKSSAFCGGGLSIKIVALPFGIAITPIVFTEVLNLILGLLCTRVSPLLIFRQLTSEAAIRLSAGNQCVSHSAHSSEAQMGHEFTVGPNPKVKMFRIFFLNIQA